MLFLRHEFEIKKSQTRAITYWTTALILASISIDKFGPINQKDIINISI